MDSTMPTYEPQVPYDVVELPSRGLFYAHNKSSVKVTYLTAADENILTSPNIINSGRLIDTLIRTKIVDRDINIDTLLECDKEAILVFLRNTAYGPEYDINLIDPKTKKEFPTTVDLSSLDFKKIEVKPDENGEFSFKLPVSNKNVKFKLLTGKEVAELADLENAYKGLEYAPVKTKFLELSITEIDGIRDREKISTMIPSMPIKDSQELRKYITKAEPGLDLEIAVKTPSGSVVNTKLQFGTAFFRPFFGL
tara:strand:- start:26304 stop:27059 length:756 start_codon:yes stop_codon:yes gene_type:complete